MNRIARRGEAFARVLCSKHRVHELEHGAGAPPRNGGAQIREGKVCPFSKRFENSAMAAELSGVRALKAENRLFLIADGEQRSGRPVFTHAEPCEKFFGQFAHDLPLLGTGILRLVDQDVIEPAVELVEHPGGGITAFEQGKGRENQIVVIERRAFALQRIERREHGERDNHQRLGERNRHCAFAAVLHHEQAPLQIFRRCRKLRRGLDAILRRDGRERLAVLLQQRAAQQIETLCGQSGFQELRQFLSAFDIAGRSTSEPFRDALAGGSLAAQIGAETREDLRFVLAFRDSQGCSQMRREFGLVAIVAGEQFAQFHTVADGEIENFREPPVGGTGRKQRNGL